MNVPEREEIETWVEQKLAGEVSLSDIRGQLEERSVEPELIQEVMHYIDERVLEEETARGSKDPYRKHYYLGVVLAAIGILLFPLGFSLSGIFFSPLFIGLGLIGFSRRRAFQAKQRSMFRQKRSTRWDWMDFFR